MRRLIDTRDVKTMSCTTASSSEDAHLAGSHRWLKDVARVDRTTALSLLLAACVPPPYITGRINALLADMSEESWGTLCSLAISVGVTPLLVWALKSIGIWERVTATQQDILEQATEAIHEHNRMILSLWPEVRARLQARGWRLVLAKESATVTRAYPNGTSRYLKDIDVLIEKDQKEAAEAYFELVTPHAPDLLDFHSAMRSSSSMFHLGQHSEAMLGAAITVEWAGGRDYALAPEHNVIWLAWHDFSHRWGHAHRLLDLVWEIASSKGTLKWRSIADQAAAWGIAPALAPDLLMARRLLGGVVPRWFIEQLLTESGVQLNALERLVTAELWGRPLDGSNRGEQWSRLMRLRLLGLPCGVRGCSLSETARRLLGHLQWHQRLTAAARVHEWMPELVDNQDEEALSPADQA